jgi:hypothetical protein
MPDVRQPPSWAATAIGVTFWLLALGLGPPGWAALLFLWAPLVLFPAALPLWHAHARPWTCVVAAVWLVPGFLLPPGPAAAAFTVPWVAFALWLAGSGVRTAVGRRDVVGLLLRGYLLVGCGWLVLARLGARPLDFPDVIVLATAIHFHYAGSLLPVLARRLAAEMPTRLARLSLAGILLGMPLVAAGITLGAFGSRWLETAATLFMAVACILWALLVVRFSLRCTAGPARTLLLFSVACLVVAMGLAVAYAVGNLVRRPWLDIPWMLRSHGVLQSLGFATFGVAGWRLHDRQGQKATIPVHDRFCGV